MDFGVWMIKEICLMCSSFKSLFIFWLARRGFHINFFVWIHVEKLGVCYFFLFFSITLIVQAKPVIIESRIVPLIATFITEPKKKPTNSAIIIRMIGNIASHNICPSSPLCTFILHLKDVVILLCLVILFGICSQIFDYCFQVTSFPQ